MDWLIDLDKSLFYFINVSLANTVTDTLMPVLTSSKTWMPLYVFLFLYLIFINPLIKKRLVSPLFGSYFRYFFISNKDGLLLALLIAIGVILSDQISASYIKEWVGRLRPCHTLENINLLVHCGGGKSFPSSHATNNYFAAGVLSYYFPKGRILFFTFAFLIAISRVFVGVHYPIDIIAGALLGLAIAYIIVKIHKLLLKNYNPRDIHRWFLTFY